MVDVLNRRDAGVRIHGDLLLLVSIDLYQLVVGFDQTVSNGHTLFGVLGEEDVFHHIDGHAHGRSRIGCRVAVVVIVVGVERHFERPEFARGDGELPCALAGLHVIDRHHIQSRGCLT